MDRPLRIGSEPASSWVTEPSSLSKAGWISENDATCADLVIMIFPPGRPALGRNFIVFSSSPRPSVAVQDVSSTVR